MNNSVKDGYGNVIGFRCWRCGDVFQSMWGETCNRCRHQDMENQKLRDEIKKLTEQLTAKP